jgi:hypothetical protein
MPQTNLEILLSAKDAASAKLEQTGNSVKTLGQRIHELNAEARAGGDKDIERLLKGGGALALASLATEAFANLGQEIQKFGQEALKGGVNYEGLVGKIAGSIPVVGGLVRGIGSVIDGIKDIQAASAKQAGDSHFAEYASAETSAKIRQEQERVRAEIVTQMRETANAIAAIGAGNFAREMQTLESQHEQRLDKIRELTQKQIEATGRRLTVQQFNESPMVVAEDERAEKEQREAELRNHERQTREAQDGRTRLAAMNAQADAEQLRAAGKTAEAEKELLKQKYDAEAIDRARKAVDAQTRDPENGAEIREQYNAEEAAAKNKLDADMKKADDDASRAAQDRARDRADREREIATQGYIGILRASGQYHAADMAELQAAHQKRLAEIERQAQKEAEHKTAAEQQAIRNAAGAEALGENLSARGQAAKAEAAYQIEQKEKGLSIDREIADIHLQTLEREAASGNMAAKAAAEKLKIAREYADEIARVQKILDNPDASMAQRMAAEKAILQLKEDETRAEKAGATRTALGAAAQDIGGDHFGGSGAGLARRSRLEDVPKLVEDVHHAISNGFSGLVAALKGAIVAKVKAVS